MLISPRTATPLKSADFAELRDTKMAAVLLELGFFDNATELKNICSDNYVNYVSNNLANEISIIIREMK